MDPTTLIESTTTFLASLHLLTLFALPALYLLARALYQLYLSPLRGVPGPWYAAVSDLWLTTHVARLRQCRAVHQLFAAYGPIVRIGPNKVAFCDVGGARSVYAVRRFDKTAFYKGFQTNDHDHSMTILPKDLHSRHKKAFAPHYTMASLTQFAPEMNQSVRELISVLTELGGRTPVDSLDLFRQLLVDIMSATSFGTRGRALGAWARAAGDADPLSSAIRDFPKRSILRGNLPAWAWAVVSRIPNRRWRQLCDSDRIMTQYVSAKVTETRTQILAAAGGDAGARKTSMIARLLGGVDADEKGHPELSDKDIISETMGHLIAGVDTSSSTLAYLCWELSRRPDIVRNLRAELDAALPPQSVGDADAETDADVDIAALFKLPYLSAFIKEGLRLYSAAPGILERVVSESESKEFTLLGHTLPAGTVVGTQAWSMHRDGACFPVPDAFCPERWLPGGATADSNLGKDGSRNEKNKDSSGDESKKTDEEAKMRKAQDAHMMPWGLGTRMCTGMTLAQIVLRLVVVAVVRGFEVRAPRETTEGSMEMRDSFVMFPAAMKCRLVYEPRGAQA
ncbi:cytochrome P450 [Dentipellis sp. KUC8613]|nr:cytochrome P450 [Dentipellis sp. KUC8613]